MSALWSTDSRCEHRADGVSVGWQKYELDIEYPGDLKLASHEGIVTSILREQPQLKKSFWPAGT